MKLNSICLKLDSFETKMTKTKKKNFRKINMVEHLERGSDKIFNPQLL